MLVAFGVGCDELDIGVLFFIAAHEVTGDFESYVAFTNAARAVEKKHGGKSVLGK
jgi:hypothetical protein